MLNVVGVIEGPWAPTTIGSSQVSASGGWQLRRWSFLEAGASVWSLRRGDNTHWILQLFVATSLHSFRESSVCVGGWKSMTSASTAAPRRSCVYIIIEELRVWDWQQQQHRVDLFDAFNNVVKCTCLPSSRSHTIRVTEQRAEQNRNGRRWWDESSAV